MDNENKPIKLSRNELEVLRILQSGPTGVYGLDIIERAGGRIDRGSVYVVLGSLEKRGLVSSRRPAAIPPPEPRPMYTITGDGLRVLAEADLRGSIGAHPDAQ
jgi:DNA-binding PadR family transcriptional regulator